MGALARALKAKFPGGPREALRALGLDESLLDIKQLAKDGALKRGRDSALSDQTEEKWLAENLSGSDFETAQLRHNRELVENMVDDDEREDDAGEREDDEPELRAKRRWLMRRLADLLSEHGDDEETIGRKLAMPKNGLMNAVGGQTEDAESVMQERPEKMGGTATSVYEREPKAKDRRRMAKDARLMGTQLGLDRLTPKRGDFCNWGDQPEPLAMDGADADDSEFFTMFPEARRLSTPG